MIFKEERIITELLTLREILTSFLQAELSIQSWIIGAELDEGNEFELTENIIIYYEDKNKLYHYKDKHETKTYKTKSDLSDKLKKIFIWDKLILDKELYAFLKKCLNQNQKFKNYEDLKEKLEEKLSKDVMTDIKEIFDFITINSGCIVSFPNYENITSWSTNVYGQKTYFIKFINNISKTPEFGNSEIRECNNYEDYKNNIYYFLKNIKDYEKESVCNKNKRKS